MMNSPLWAIDAGNTTLKIALYYGTDLHKVYRLERGPWDESISHLCRKASAFKEENTPGIGVSVSAARPNDVPFLEKLARALCPDGKIFFPSSDGPLPFTYRYTDGAPGPDRLANAAALAHLAPNRPAMAVDFGTTTHLSAVNKKGHFIGGVIFPGIALQFEILNQATGGRLPALTADSGTPLSPTANSTSGAIRSGVLLAQSGAVEKIISLFRQEQGDQAKVFVTGGGATLIHPHLSFDYTPHENLTTLGLVLIWHHAMKVE